MNTEIKKEIKGEIKKIMASKFFKNVVYIFGVLIIASVIFETGVFVGFHKATFDRDWGDNYSRNFGSMHKGRIGGMSFPEDFPNAHGTIGKIIKVDLPTIVVEDADKTERVVLVSDDTIIRKMRENVSLANLSLDSSVIVIGSPNTQGQIEAKLIRILPSTFTSPIPVVPSNK